MAPRHVSYSEINKENARDDIKEGGLGIIQSSFHTVGFCLDGEGCCLARTAWLTVLGQQHEKGKETEELTAATHNANP